ncbi:DNA methyltransferase, partial [Heyndrickxia coagulans]|uniref:DNA methyltransferase n=1 Tax=Heyndrickxia coagulans TaxID=1398 RepID=UPI002DFF30AE
MTKYGRNPNEEYHREPFAADVSEGKNDPIYNAHSYHTKVPPKAIMRYLLHYTKPGDVVFDGFSGTGMTGISGKLCDNEKYISELGFSIKNNVIYDESNNPISEKGIRNTILIDLSTYATFITKNYNHSIKDIHNAEKEMLKIIDKVHNEYGHLYTTTHEDGISRGTINYVIWSDVFICPSCTNEIVFWNTAVDNKTGKVLNEFNCPYCDTKLKKNQLERSFESKYDPMIRSVVSQAKQRPVLINYTINKKRYNKRPDEKDLQLIEDLSKDSDVWCPINKLPLGYNTSQPIKSHGIKYVHQFYTNRNLLIFARLFEYVERSKYKDVLLFVLSSINIHINKMRRYQPVKPGGTPGLPGTLFVSSLNVELSIFDVLPRKLRDLKKAYYNSRKETAIVSTGSATDVTIRENSIDYIFTDPPFGSNLMYSELNYLWESWLKVFTNNEPEAIVNKFQNKELFDYQNLMERAFKEYYRILKPGRWITVEFSNSQASVWNVIQEAIQQAGFVIANVSALDKKQGSFKAVTTTTAVKQDLVISAYKPKKEHIEKISNNKNTPESAWIFVTQHLEQLPIFFGNKGEAEIIPERTPRILFDRMVAYHVRNGLQVPLSSAEFQMGVSQRFPMRDGMVFLESQVAEYDKKRTLISEFTQLSLFVSDENSAIEWIRQQLMNKPQTRQELHPEFMKQIQHIAKHEELPELDDLLEQNFLRYDGEEPVPNQILTYLRRNYKDLRGLDPTDPKVIEKAMHRWYVPDPNKQSDLEKLREKALLREFNQYKDELEGNKKKLRTFRTEAIRAGFKNAYRALAKM